MLQLSNYSGSPGQASIKKASLTKKEPMRQQLTITLALLAILASTVFVKIRYYPDLQGQSAYHFTSIFWICGILIAIFGFHLVWQLFHGRTHSQHHKPFQLWANRRNTFRIIYPSYLRPVLVVETADDRERRNLEFPIVDLSQGGSCFLDDGSLGRIDCFSGHIRLYSGDRVRVSGRMLRKRGSQVSVEFLDAIDWSTLLNEQRSVLTQMRAEP